MCIFHPVKFFWQEKKEREEKEREARIAQGLADEVNCSRNIEQALLNKRLSDRGFKLYDVGISYQISIVCYLNPTCSKL